MLRFREIQKLLKGTKLEGLTENQLKEAMVGEYPISHGSKEFSRIWHDVMIRADERWKLKYFEIDCLLDDMLMKIYESKTTSEKKKEQINKVEALRSYNKESYQVRLNNDYLQSIVNDCQILLADYETQIRSRDVEIRSLKQSIGI